MATVSHVVTRILEGMPFLEEALVRDIINYAYLAEMIRPEVESELRHPAKRSAIVMAIRRFREALKGSEIRATALKLTGLDISVKSGIFEITVNRNADTVNALQGLYGLVDFAKGDVLTITQGLYEITILSNTKYMEQIKRILGAGHVLRVIDGLSSLMVRIPESASETVGIIYILVKALSWNNVNIVEVVSTLTEEIFIIKEEDTSIAFNALKNLAKA
jgi:aspartokinase